jgi:hypothetical protein
MVPSLAGKVFLLYRVNEWRMSMIALFWPLLLPPLLAVSILDQFPFPPAGAIYSDLAISHYSNAVFLLRAIGEWRQLPLWSPTILGGYPFAANPLSGIWYPPGWLALILPLPLGFNLLVALHLLWGGIGMYLLLREQGLGHRAGLCAALAFEGMPKLFAHFGAGHLSLLYAVPWTPWLLFAWERTRARFEKAQKPAGEGMVPGVVMGLIFLADPRWALYAGVLWFGWAFAHSQDGKRVITVLRLSGQTFLAALVAAPLALPLLEYTLLSSRASLSIQENLVFSLPPERLLGFFFPGIQGHHEWVLYPGALVLLLSAWAILAGPKNSRAEIRFWAYTAVLATLLSLGGHIPGFSLLAGLPGFGLLRVPPRALFASGIALAVLAGYGLEGLLDGSNGRHHRRAGLALVAMPGFALLMALSVRMLSGELPVGFAWGAAAFLAGGIWLGIRLLFSVKPVPGVWLAGLLLLGLVDLGTVDLTSFVGHGKEAVLAGGEAAASFLSTQPGRFRVYSPSYSLPQQTAARYGLELLDGVDPLHLEYLAAYMDEASGVPRSGYSVTVPPFPSGSPKEDNRAYRPDPESLGLMNVAFILAEYDLPVEGLILRARFGETRLYENAHARPRAWVQPSGGGNDHSSSAARVVDWTPNQITLTATGPGLLVLSEVVYPGWQVKVGREPKEVEVAHGLLRGVQIGPGENRVVFQFKPASLLMGGCLSLTVLIFLMARMLFRGVNQRMEKV